MASKFNKKLDESRLRKLHGMGMNDVEISDLLGVHRTTVQKARSRVGLEPNGEKHERKFSDEEMIELYEKGWGDYRIAKRLGVHRTAVSQRRKRLGLEPNFPQMVSKGIPEPLRDKG